MADRVDGTRRIRRGSALAPAILGTLLAATAGAPGAALARGPAPPKPIAASLIRGQWATAENRATCAPLAFTDSAGAGGRARRANFSGGWAVAFDLPGLRSAYGVAGVGLLPDDTLPASERRAGLAAQWPYAWGASDRARLPAGSFAGYGVEGAQNNTPEDPRGRRHATMLAYLIVPGQTCLYNVWSRLGRDHLVRLLDGLARLPQR